MTVYIVIPPREIERYSRFIRCLANTALASVTRTNKKPPNNVLFMLDEFPKLGHMKAFVEGISIVRGYGGSFWIVIQDMAQLKSIYKEEWATFVSNSTKHFFGVADYETAKYISDSIGQTTISFETENRGESISKDVTNQHGQSQNLQGRLLITPDEVMALGDTKALVMPRGERPYLVGRMNYLNDPIYQQKALPNPYH